MVFSKALHQSSWEKLTYGCDMGENQVVGALCTVALLMRTTEFKKKLYDRTEEQLRSIIEFINIDKLLAIFLERNNTKEQNYAMDP
jgi:hypothetical protein